MKKSILCYGIGLILLLLGREVFAAEATNVAAAANAAEAPGWLTAPLSLPEAVDLALRQNSDILRAKSDIEANQGIIIQTRAIAWPKVRGNSAYTYNQAIEKLQFTVPTNVIPSGTFTSINPGQNNWNGTVQVIQSIYEGGRITSAFRTAKLTKEQVLLQYNAVVADTIFAVRSAYYDVLLAEQQITVQEASLGLLQEELKYARSKAEAGVVPRFNVLRAEVEVANARPRVIQAKNAYRIAKNNLANLLSYQLPPQVLEDIPMNLTDKPQAEPFDINLSAAVQQALQNRPELGVLRKAEALRREAIVTAKAGYKPSLGVFGGYNARSPNLTDDFFSDVSGWLAGVQMDWNIFDGNLTRGRVKEAEARLQGARVDLDATSRRIELEVRTAYSQFIEAKEVLEAQRKVLEQAEEAVRLARSRWEAQTGTQLDVLNAQTSLTEARSTQVQALHDYAVARARLERAIGVKFEKTPQKP